MDRERLRQQRQIDFPGSAVSQSSRSNGIWPDAGGPAIIAPNHTSYLDGPALALITPKPILFAVDPQFSTRQPWRSILLAVGRIRSCEMVPMEIGSPKGIRALARRLEAGGWVCIFPEGGIGTGQSHPGVHWLAQKTGARIHPISIRTVGAGKIRIPLRISAA